MVCVGVVDVGEFFVVGVFSIFCFVASVPIDMVTFVCGLIQMFFLCICHGEWC